MKDDQSPVFHMRGTKPGVVGMEARPSANKKQDLSISACDPNASENCGSAAAAAREAGPEGVSRSKSNRGALSNDVLVRRYRNRWCWFVKEG